jgi:plasmid stabilization system protein ParE
MPMHLFGAFEPEAIAEMTEALEAACEELKDQPEVVREIVAQRIILAVRFGERDPVRLRETALRGRDHR